MDDLKEWHSLLSVARYCVMNPKSVLAYMLGWLRRSIGCGKVASLLRTTDDLPMGE